ncbi:MAG: HNH endonuclease [Peptostreptococcaceae bacterium]
MKLPNFINSNIFSKVKLNMEIEKNEIFECMPTFEKKEDIKEYRYSRDWIRVSEEYKEDMNWICEECGLDCFVTKYYLHVHHLNENKFNNSWRNLKAVCRSCNNKLYK